MRIGQGFDAHRLVPGRPLRLGGIEVPFERGLEGHSDGDVLLHAAASALLGALGAGDLGTHFPSSDPSLRGISSRAMLSRVVERMHAAQYRLGNLDATLIAQVPRLAPFRERMQAELAVLLEVPLARVNLKITSTDRLGDLGREQGIAALCVVLLEGDPAGAAA